MSQRGTHARYIDIVKSTFVHKKYVANMLDAKTIRIKRDMKNSSIKEGRNMKGYKVRNVFQK